MTSILAYCRPGYENDTANELATRYGEKEYFGYPVSVSYTHLTLPTICSV